MKFLALVLLLNASTAFAADLLNSFSLVGKTQGKSCKSVVTQLLQKKVGAQIQLYSYKNLTAGSYNQEFQARFSAKGKQKSALLTGAFDCDNLQIVGIQ
jgi:hypothetical protein